VNCTIKYLERREYWVADALFLCGSWAFCIINLWTKVVFGWSPAGAELPKPQQRENPWDPFLILRHFYDSFIWLLSVSDICHTPILLSTGKFIWLLHWLYTVSQKKTSHFNFRHNFAICWDIFYNFWSILFRNNSSMTQCSTYSQSFIYVVVRRTETVSYTKCTKSAVIRQKNTRNQQVAKLSVNIT